MIVLPYFEPVVVYALVALVVTTLVGLCSLLFAVGRSRAGSVVGVLLLLHAMGITFALIMFVPRYWWLGMPPMYLGIQSLLTWQHTSPSFTKVRLSSILLLTCFLLLIVGGYSSVHRQRQLEKPIVEELESILKVDNGQVDCYFDGITSRIIIYYNSPIDMKRVVELISQLRYLESIQVFGDGLADVDLTVLLKLTRLRDFLVQQTDLNDHQLKVISELPRLQSLDLMDTPVTDEGVLQLAKTKTLRHLWVSERITEDAIQTLSAVNPDLEIRH